MGRGRVDAEFGLADHLDAHVVQKFCPTGDQRNNAHFTKVVRYLCRMNAPVRFAVVGFGHIGARHVAMVTSHPEAELVAVADVAWRESPPGDGAVGQLPSSRLFASLTELLAAHGAEVDVVAVCTPNGTHVDLALESLASDCHVLVEKPMGLRPDHVEALAVAAKRAGKHVFGVMQNRYAPAAQWLKRTVDTHKFGDIHQVHVTCLWNRDDRYYTPGSWRGTRALDGGPLFTQFSHFLDILMWVFGEVRVEAAFLENQTHQATTEFEDSGVVRFRLAQGGWGTLTFSTSVPNGNFESSMTVLGSKGVVRIGGQYMDRLDDCRVEGLDAPKLPASPPPNDYGGYTGSAANHHFVYDNVMDVLLRGAAIATPIEEGLAVVRVIDRVHRLGRAEATGLDTTGADT